MCVCVFLLIVSSLEGVKDAEAAESAPSELKAAEDPKALAVVDIFVAKEVLACSWLQSFHVMFAI